MTQNDGQLGGRMGKLSARVTGAVAAAAAFLRGGSKATDRLFADIEAEVAALDAAIERRIGEVSSVAEPAIEDGPAAFAAVLDAKRVGEAEVAWLKRVRGALVEEAQAAFLFEHNATIEATAARLRDKTLPSVAALYAEAAEVLTKAAALGTRYEELMGELQAGNDFLRSGDVLRPDLAVAHPLTGTPIGTAHGAFDLFRIIKATGIAKAAATGGTPPWRALADAARAAVAR